MKKIFFIIAITILAFTGVIYATGNKDMINKTAILDDTFVLHSFDGNEISIPADKAFPTFKFNTDEGIITGFAGCNNIRGNFSLSNDKIDFGAIAATKKACFNDEYEPQILKIFTEANEYIREDNLLTLKKDDKILMILRELKLD